MRFYAFGVGAVLVWLFASQRAWARRKKPALARAVGACLSLRGQGVAGGQGPSSYIMEHIMRLGHVYCAEERPRGYICLAISENRLAYPLYKEALAAVRPTGR